MSIEIGLPLVGVLFLLLAKVQGIAHRDRLIREWQRRRLGSVYQLPRDRSYESLLRETDYRELGRTSVTRNILPPQGPRQERDGL